MTGFNQDGSQDRYPLSPMQSGMLFESVYAPGSGVNILQLVMSLSGDLDLASFERAWQLLAERHAILRTRFLWAGLTQPLQEVQPAVSMPFLVEASPIETYLREDRRRGFDLDKAPLMRVAVFREGPANYQAVWTFHHILLDGRSFTSLLAELFEAYDALRKGEAVDFEVRPPYRQFIDWLSGRDVDLSKAYWSGLLEGFTAPTPLGVDRHARPGVTIDPQRGRQRALLPEELGRNLRDFAARNGLTVGTLIQGAWAILLNRYSGEQDVLFGVTRACRRSTVEGSDRIVGLFINTLPVRARIDSGTELLPFLRELRVQSIAVRPHEHTPLVKIKQWSSIAPDKPLFESLVVFEKYAWEEALPERGGVWQDRSFHLLQQSSLPLNLAVNDAREPIVRMEYDPSRFDEPTILRMIGHLQTILEGIASSKFVRVAELPMLTEQERQRMLVDWNAAEREYPKICIHELFERQASRQPDLTAVVCEGSEITYGELDRWANRVAHHLRTLGVGPDAIVGLCAERSLEMVIGIIGILKSGGAYLPLEPAQPRQRLEFMISDGGARVVLVQEKLAGNLSAPDVLVIPIESAGLGFPDSKPPGQPGLENLAYLMYTSGSTGMPKGVEIEHRNVVAFLHSFVPFDCLSERRIGTNVATFSFDTSIEEIFACLCFGGTVHVMKPEHSTDAPYFAEYLVKHRVNCSYIVPDLLEPVAGELEKLGCGMPLRILMTGLAPKRQRALQAFRSLSSELKVLNIYGPTEVTYGATAFEFAEAADPEAEVPIGRPFTNYQVYVVDQHMQPVPVGVAGELLIGGVGVARGYRNRPELTAGKFIPDFLSGRPGARLYRSGDLVRYIEDGNIEFLGRIDEQVKIRGYRVEPGEVEHALAQHEGVKRAFVMPRRSPAGDPRLVAYVVPEGAPMTAADLRAFLRESLPAYMVPPHYVFLENLPLMANGKIDRKALPDPDWLGQRQSAAEDEPPSARDGIEAQLVKIWERVLGVHPIGLKDSFFELGGHSLLAVSLFAQMEKVFGRRLPLASLFQAPTVEQLAKLLRTKDLVPDWSPLVPIQPRGERPPFFAVHAYGGDVLFYRELARHLGEDQPFYGLQAVGLSGERHPLKRIDDMAARYLREVRAVQPEGPYRLGGYCMGAYVALEMARQLESEGQQAVLLVSFAADGSWKKANYLGAGIAMHLRTLARLNGLARASYIAWRLRFRLGRVRESLIDLYSKFLVSSGRTLPADLRHRHVRECHYQANLRYQAKSFSGAVTYFRPERAPTADPNGFWGEIARAGIEVHTVPGVDEDIFREPNVAELARRLRACLDRAQAPGALT